MTTSIIHPKFEGTLVLISGLHGLGKTMLASTMENPLLTGMIDFDIKGRSLAQELGIGFYASPDYSTNPDDYDVKVLAEWFFKTLTKIPTGTTHLIIDNATWVEAGLEWRVMQNPNKYGVKESNARTGGYGGAKPGVTVLWSNIFTYLQNKGIKVVTVINHMSQPWVNGAPTPNKFTIKGSKVFNQLASFAVILVPAIPARGGRYPIPSGLVVKEALAVSQFNDGEFITTKVIPPRIPVCNWKNINSYFNSPADFSQPRPGEEWSQAEVNSYSEWLSPEQIEWVKSIKSYSEEDERIEYAKLDISSKTQKERVSPHFPGTKLEKPKLTYMVNKLKSLGYNPESLMLQVFGEGITMDDLTEVSGHNLMELAKRYNAYKEKKLDAQQLGHPELMDDALYVAMEQECLTKSHVGEKWPDLSELLNKVDSAVLEQLPK